MNTLTSFCVFVCCVGCTLSIYDADEMLLFFQCGWANASDAIEIMCISFTIDSLNDSLNILPAEATWLSVVLFLGNLLQCYNVCLV